MVDLTAVQITLRTQLLTLSALPAGRAWENEKFAPVTDRPYIEESFVPATTTLRGLTKGGTVETTGLYLIRWYGVANTGLGDLTAGVDALLALFPPGLALTTTTGDVVRIRGDIAPYRGGIKPDQSGWSMCVVTIPWRVFSINPT